MNTWATLAAELQQWQWIGILIARIAVGVLFAITGYGKLFVPAKRKEMQETLRKAGLPAPDMSAVVLSSIEFVFGVFLAIGFFTPLSCIMLIGVMIGALWTTVLPGIKATSPMEWVGKFLFLPETLYLVILVWLLFSGAGPASVDSLILPAA